MAFVGAAYIIAAYQVMANKIMAYKVMAYKVMASIVMIMAAARRCLRESEGESAPCRTDTCLDFCPSSFFFYLFKSGLVRRQVRAYPRRHG